jgi:hypothetical protein
MSRAIVTRLSGAATASMTSDILGRVAALDWAAMAAALDAHGAATADLLLGPEECDALAGCYNDDTRFRSRVIMAQHGFGRGEYKYFANPLPELIADLRAALYPPLAEIANRWTGMRRWDRCSLPGRARRIPKALPPGGADKADPAAVALRVGRLQLLAPGPLRRARVSTCVTA